MLFASFPIASASSGGIPPRVFDAHPTYLLAAAPALHYGLLYTVPPTSQVSQDTVKYLVQIIIENEEDEDIEAFVELFQSVEEKLNFAPPTNVEGVSLAFNDFLLPQIAKHHKALIPKKLKTSQKTLLPLQLYNLLFASFPMASASSNSMVTKKIPNGKEA